MLTYQDLLEHSSTEERKMEFVKRVIADHRSSEEYRNAITAHEYYEKKNSTILAYQKLLYTMSGEAVPDNYSANYKMCSGFYEFFTKQEIQYLLGNGVTLGNAANKEKLGKNFDYLVQKSAREARLCGVSFLFWNLDHVQVFTLEEFAPLTDETDGALKSGVRFWQVSPEKPLRATLYELDGYTEYIWNTRDDKTGRVLNAKRPYKEIIKETAVDGAYIYAGENYPTFPIVPMFGNDSHISTLTGLREGIDCYDLIKSGFADDVDDASLIYWTIQNAGGMDDIDLRKFIDHMRRVKAAVVEQDGASAESHTVDVPYGSREAILTRIEKDLYRDAMALDVTNIIGGAATATQIRAAYEPLNEKDDDFEYYVTDAITKILELAGVEDTLSYSRSVIVNKNEEIGIVLQASEYLPEKYVTEKILTILGDADRLDEIMEEKETDEAEMYAEEEGEEEGEDAEALEDSEGEESAEDSELDDFMADFEEEDSEGAEDAEEEEEEEDTGALDALMEKLKKILGRLG